MDIRPLRAEADYEWALTEIAAYFDKEPERGTPDADRFDVLAMLIESYEAKHWPIEPPDAIAAIEEVMALKGYKRSDLARVLGSSSRASEILKRRRSLSMEMVHRLNVEWHIPAEVLIRPYALAPTSASRLPRQRVDC